MKSLITDDLEHCLISYNPNVCIHHCLEGTGNRQLSDDDGLIVPLEPRLHNEGKRPNDKDLLGVRCDVHHCKNMAKLMHIIGQQAYMMNYIIERYDLSHESVREEAKQAFMSRYGKNYL